MSVTGASRTEAKRFLAAAKGEVDAAVTLYFEQMDSAGDEDVKDEADDVEMTSPDPPSSSAPAAGGASMDAVGAILGAAEESSKKSEEENKWKGGSRLDGKEEDSDGKGKGKGKKRPSKVTNVHVWFFSDGFTVSDDPSLNEEEEETTTAPAAKAAVRKTGLASLSDYKDASASSKRPKMPKLPPLRSYDTPENVAFLAALKSGHVPPELQKRDPETNEPIGVAFAVTDLRPRSHKEFSELEKKFKDMEEKEEGAKAASKPKTTLFEGAGHSLSGPSSSSAPQGTSGGSGAGADPALVNLVACGQAALDSSKPTTTIQLRLANGSRVKAQLNLDHTVADLWCIVAANMGEAAFKSASEHALVAGFPPKPLTDPMASIQDAGLASAAITHRCKT